MPDFDSSRSGLDLGRFRSGKPAGSIAAVNPPSGLALVARERRVKEILSTVENLPALPNIVVKIMRVVGDRDAMASDVEELVRQDQALTAKVLKLVNSPFFGVRTPVTSVRDAVVRLGFNTLKSVVVAARTSKLLTRQLTPYGFDKDGMWQHSVGTAAVARHLGRAARLDPADQETLFVAGLLHDVGKVILAPHISSVQAEFDEALGRNDGDLLRTESDVVGISHDETGRSMAEKWNLDETLRHLIGRHHKSDAGGSEAGRLRALQAANDWCNQLGVGRAAGGRDPHPDFASWLSEIGVGSREELAADVQSCVQEAQAAFDQLRT